MTAKNAAESRSANRRAINGHFEPPAGWEIYRVRQNRARRWQVVLCARYMIDADQDVVRINERGGKSVFVDGTGDSFKGAWSAALAALALPQKF